MDLNLHRMSLDELKTVRKQLRADKKPRTKTKHKMLLKACEAWIKRRAKEKKQ